MIKNLMFNSKSFVSQFFSHLTVVLRVSVYLYTYKFKIPILNVFIHSILARSLSCAYVHFRRQSDTAQEEHDDHKNSCSNVGVATNSYFWHF